MRQVGRGGRTSRAAAAGCVAALAATLTAITAGPAGATGEVPAPTPAPAAPAPAIVVTGLDNPRQLSLDTTGTLLTIAEAGKGGPNCVDGISPDGGQTCLGPTGAVSLVVLPQFANNQQPWRIVTGLLSGAAADGSAAVGPDGVAAPTLDKISIAETWAPPDAIPLGLPRGQLGKLLHTSVFGALHVEADLAGYERAHDPDGQGFDSNPYAVLALPEQRLVADAAANDIVAVSPGLAVSTFAVLPNIQTGLCAGVPNDAGTTGCDPVPTSLALGPDGSIYVGGLGSETPGAGRVWKLDRVTGKILATWTGLSAVTGVAVGPDGSVYASQLFTTAGLTGPDLSSGRVTRIRPDGSRTDRPVPMPAGLAADRFGNVFVSAYSLAPDTGMTMAPGRTTPPGQVWRLRF